MPKLRILSSTGSSAAAAILISSIIAGPASAASSPLGVWLDDKGRGAVEIAQCGAALCGKVVWVKSAKDSKGCGAKILDGVKPAGNNTWDYGWIYSPDHGRRFDLALTPQGNDRLRVTGYAGIKLFSESRTWTRAPADLPRCDASETAAAAKPQPVKQAALVAPKTDAAPVAADKPVAPAQAKPADPAPAETAPPSDKDDAADKSPPQAAPGETATAEASDPDPYASAPRAKAPSLGGLSIDKVLKKSADGSCKLDLPWVKVKFSCKDF